MARSFRIVQHATLVFWLSSLAADQLRHAANRHPSGILIWAHLKVPSVKSRPAPACASAPFGRSIRKTQGGAGPLPKFAPRGAPNPSDVVSTETLVHQSRIRRDVCLQAVSKLASPLNTILRAKILFCPPRVLPVTEDSQPAHEPAS